MPIDLMNADPHRLFCTPKGLISVNVDISSHHIEIESHPDGDRHS
jgi:hypothetical protein